MNLEKLKMVEIEIHSHCNRQCTWCPNSKIDRHSEMIEMSEWTYLSILYELKNAGFKGVITYSRNNEPMANIELLRKRTQQAREILPDCLLVTNTNGDFLTEENLYGLQIDELSVMDYDGIGVNEIVGRLEDLGLDIDSIEGNYIYASAPGMKIIYAANWAKEWADNDMMNSKGGIIERYERIKRTTPCMEPTYFLAIDYNGNVTPCCHIRSDAVEHKDYILGNLYTDTIKDVYYGDKAVKFREEVANANFNEKSPCTYCNKTPGRYIRDDNPGIDWK